MLLCVDIGNSNIVTGVFKGQELVHEWRMSTLQGRTMDEYGLLFMSFLRQHKITLEDVSGISLCSVVPPLNSLFLGVSRDYFEREPFVVGPGIKTGLKIRYHNPKELGADRIVNAVAAHKLWGGPLIIVDFGTATTFCALNSKGEYLGGAISPGLGISVEALFQKAAKLPRVDLVRPENVIGKTTTENLQSGLLYGYIGQVEGMVARISAEMGEAPKVVATGGLAAVLAPETDSIDEYAPHLTLEGLRILYGMNMGKRS